MKPITIECRDPKNNPDWWFDDTSDVKGSRNTKERLANTMIAMRICANCPLFGTKECLQEGFKSIHTLDYGVFSGTLPLDRRRALGMKIDGPKYDFHRKIRNLAILEGLPIPDMKETQTWAKDIATSYPFFSLRFSSSDRSSLVFETKSRFTKSK